MSLKVGMNFKDGKLDFGFFSLVFKDCDVFILL